MVCTRCHFKYNFDRVQLLRNVVYLIEVREYSPFSRICKYYSFQSSKLLPNEWSRVCFN